MTKGRIGFCLVIDPESAAYLDELSLLERQLLVGGVGVRRLRHRLVVEERDEDAHRRLVVVIHLGAVEQRLALAVVLVVHEVRLGEVVPQLPLGSVHALVPLSVGSGSGMFGRVFGAAAATEATGFSRVAAVPAGVRAVLGGTVRSGARTPLVTAVTRLVRVSQTLVSVSVSAVCISPKLGCVGAVVALHGVNGGVARVHAAGADRGARLLGSPRHRVDLDRHEVALLGSDGGRGER